MSPECASVFVYNTEKKAHLHTLLGHSTSYSHIFITHEPVTRDVYHFKTKKETTSSLW